MLEEELIIADEDELPDTFIERLEMQKGQAKLDLTLCQIRKVPVNAICEYFGEPEDLDLDLSYNMITYIEPNFVKTLAGNLTKLDLRKNKIRMLPGNFGDLKQLVYLDLHENELETLPLSMGKMTRLTFLCLSGNPFRPPLSSILDNLGENVSGLALADYIVSFLKVVKDSVDSNDNLKGGIRRKPSSIRYRRRRSSSRIRQEETSSDSSELDDYDDIHDEAWRMNKQRSRSSFNWFPWSIGKTVLITVLWFVLIPLMVAYIADTSFLEQVASESPTFDAFYNGYNYKGVHIIAAKVIKLLPENQWALKGAPPSSMPLLSDAAGGIVYVMKGVFWGYVNFVKSTWNFAAGLLSFFD